ncbi:hypothetical protein TY87_16980 [Marinomonas sp. BSi20584]|nr:hypothetical protein TY87_16980 [Marinomonas sp. BSi20584]
MKNVACINHFYKFEDGSGSLEEKFFSVIDDKAPKVIKKIISKEYDSKLNDEDKINLIKYISSQIIRVPFHFESIEIFDSAFKKQITDGVSLFEEGVKSKFLHSIIESTKQYTDILCKLSMKVLKNSSCEFVIGDNPVMVFEHNNNVVSNGESAASINGKIFMMPLSPNDMLIYFDPLFENEISAYMKVSNYVQFSQSSQLVFGRNAELLELKLKEYYSYSYDFIRNTSPDLLLESKVKRGDPISICKPQYVFEGQALEVLKEFANRKLT